MEEPTNEIYEEDEIDLLELFGVLFKYKLFIIAVTLIAAFGVVVYSILSLKLPPEKSFLPNKYRGQALILVHETQQGGLSSIVASSGLGSLASLAGVSTGQSYGELAVKLLKSKSLLDRIVEEYNIIERYEIEKYLPIL